MINELASSKATQIEKRWKNKKDSVGKRFVSTLFRDYRRKDALTKAILEDDPRFIKEYAEGKDFSKVDLPLFCFEAACLCGSENIALYLSENEKVNIRDSEDAVAYALSSRNMNFALEIAKLAKKNGQTDMGLALIYPFGKYSDFEKIRVFLSAGDQVKLRLSSSDSKSK